tara:strand:- start:46 stop:1467 length:1422 start_codon:yes stop_codon:yes gene_type:complete
MQNMAQGGIIGYDAGKEVDADEAKLVAAFGKDYQQVLADMSPEQRKSAVEALGIRSNIGGFFGGIADIATLPFRAAKENYQDFKESPVGQAITGGIGYKKPVTKPEDNAPLSIEQLQAAAIPKEEVIVEEEEAEDTTVASPVVVTKDPSLEEKAKIASTEGVKGLEESIAKSAKETPLADAMKNNGLAEALRIREDTTGIPAAQKAAIAASDENLGRDTKEKENERLIADEKAYTARQLDPEKLRKQGLQSALIGMGQRGLLGAAMGVQQSDAQTEKFEISQRAKTVKMIQDKQKTDIDVAKIGETNARNVYSTLHAKSDAAMNAMVGATQAELELAGQRADQLIARYGQDLDAKFKVLDAEYKDKILAATQEENQGKRLSDLLAIVTETDIKVNEFLSTDPNYSEGQKIAARVNGDPEKRQELSPEEAALYDAYEATRAGLEKRNATLQRLQKEIEKIAGISGTTGTYPVDE